MPTEAGKKAARIAATKAMSGETRQTFAKRAGIDPQTLGDFLAGRRWPTLKTLARIEDALGMTRGTLAALGEETDTQPAPIADAADLSRIATEILLTELAYRYRHLENRVAELQDSTATPTTPSTPEPAPVDFGAVRRGRVIEAAVPVARAARSGRSHGKALADELDRAGEENQDGGDFEPA